MASKYTHDAVATIGTYKDRQTGEEKKNYITVGKCFTDDQGRQSIRLNAIPVGPEWSGWISLYPAERRDNGSQRQQAPAPQQSAQEPRNAVRGMPPVPPATQADDNDDIPF